jgi:hypothetical protein
MAVNNVYRVTYHFELKNKRCSDVFQDNVIAASNDFNTIAAVLTNNGKTNSQGGNLVIISIGHVMTAALS